MPTIVVIIKGNQSLRDQQASRCVDMLSCHRKPTAVAVFLHLPFREMGFQGAMVSLS